VVRCLFAVDVKPRALVIDVSDVDFLASAALEALVAARFTADAAMPVVVVADGPITRGPIEVTGIHERVIVYPTLDDALAAVGERISFRYGKLSRLGWLRAAFDVTS
jgi:anti-sigma B factor antagonist